jgi:hypothetical protein
MTCKGEEDFETLPPVPGEMSREIGNVGRRKNPYVRKSCFYGRHALDTKQFECMQGGRHGAGMGVEGEKYENPERNKSH